MQSNPFIVLKLAFEGYQSFSFLFYILSQGKQIADNGTFYIIDELQLAL